MELQEHQVLPVLREQLALQALQALQVLDQEELLDSVKVK
jgi:hypothetical protein